MLKLKNVSKYYYQNGIIAEGFSKVNLELHLGEFVVITGESGSGKTTLINVLSGLDSYEDGEMYINGEETSHYTEKDYLEYRRKYVSNIFQNFNLVNSYTVYQNIELVMLLNGFNKYKIRKEVNDLINIVGLKKFKNTKVSKLSGGQKQRVAIARALANDTPIIVLDEPTGNLDSKSSKEILELLNEISKNKLVIMVTHNKKEVEKYATRFIRMHDGKILENRVINKINLDNNLTENTINNPKLITKLLLGIRNTFNIPIKFILMFSIFMLIILTIFTNYTSLQIAENEEINGRNYYFTNNSDKRIIINKKDKSIFDEEDYNKISNLNNVDHIVKNDLINDNNFEIYGDNFYLHGFINTNKIDHVDIGILPQKDNEIVIIGNKKNWYINSLQEELFNTNFNINNNEYTENIRIVGIIYNDNINEMEFEFVLNNTLLERILISYNYMYTDTKISINNNYLKNDDYTIIPFSNIPKGKAIIKDKFNALCNNYDCLNNSLKIIVNNIYYQDSLNLKIDGIYNQNNYNKYSNLNYDSQNIIYLNIDDYNYLYNKGNYQSSIFVKEIKDIDDTINELDKLNINTLKMRDANLNMSEELLQFFKIFKLIIIVILVVALFFITYFIIKIIYKSRNSYYTTLRMLGSTKSTCINILMNELISFSTITYGVFLILVYLSNQNIIKWDYLNEMIKYITLKEYIIVYLIIIILSIFISLRYGRKIFKNSIIKTYGEKI